MITGYQSPMQSMTDALYRSVVRTNIDSSIESFKKGTV